MITKEMIVLRPVQTLVRGRVVTASKLAKVLGTSTPTARRRLEDPSTLTLGEIFRLVDARIVTADEVREALHFGRGGKGE